MPAFEEMLKLHTGQRFSLNGKCYIMSDYSGTHWGQDSKGEYARIKVFPCGGGNERHVMVRENSKLVPE